jgi:hypothetical protein
MADDRIGIDEIQSALSEAGYPWEAGVTDLSSLPLERQAQYLGVTPPPGEPSIEEIAQRAIEMKDQGRGALCCCRAGRLRLAQCRWAELRDTG